jgi:TrmH family RNA methyltransferase
VLSKDDLIASIKHPAVAAARKQLAGPDYYAVDGEKLAGQALAARAEVEALFLLDGADDRTSELAKQCAGAGVPAWPTTKGVFFKLLGLGYQTSVATLAVVRRPGPAPLPEAVDPGFCAILGECIQDPRNVGVIVRTADGFGPAAAAFTADSADPYSRAAVRSSTGSIFRVTPALPTDAVDYVRRLQSLGVRAIGTSAGAETPCWAADLAGPVALIVGNESEGVSDTLAAACDELVTIPMRGGAHSFNVTIAAGICLYERARQSAVES